MPSQNIHVLADVVSLEQLCEEVAKLQKVLRYLLDGNLDFENVRVRGLTAETIDVQQLSAISADLGTIIAGFIYGTYIATKNGAYPRAEMDSTNNHFAALADVNHYLKIGSFGTGSVPFLEFRDLVAGLSAIINLGSQFQILVQKRIDLTSSTDDIYITAANIRLNSITRVLFSNLMDGPSGTSLATQLSAKANGSGINGTVYVATSPGGAANTAITFSNGIRTS